MIIKIGKLIIEVDEQSEVDEQLENYRARLQNDYKVRGYGETIRSAIGDLVINFAAQGGIMIVEPNVSKPLTIEDLAFSPAEITTSEVHSGGCDAPHDFNCNGVECINCGHAS